jgi:FMN-dependent NADH-azoreductase
MEGMKTILLLKSSLFSTQGQSSRLAEAFVASLAAQSPTRIAARDLAAEPVPHLDAERFQAFVTPQGERSERQKAIVAYSDALIDELRGADLVVIGLPMYNFGVPSQLKSWIDHIARAGETFRYTESGSVGLLRGKKAYVFAARGGRYAGTPADSQTAYLRAFLAFIGLTEVEFVYAEGLALGEPGRTQALDAARREIERLASRLPIAA